MAKGNEGKNIETESTKETYALQKEIDKLKEKVAEQDEIIDDLVAERDDLSDEIYDVRLILADAWNIARNTKHEKIWEVLRREREIKETQGQKKQYSEVAKSFETILTTNPSENGKTPNASVNLNATDSGFVNTKSLTQLIDERVKHAVDVELKNRIKTDTRLNQVEQSSSKQFIQANFNQTSRIDSEKSITKITDSRELNVIVHGIKEEKTSSQCNAAVKELFNTLEVVDHPTIQVDRLGKKVPDKIRPIRIRLGSHKSKQEFMSSLWKLKNGPDRLQKISVTDDFTQEERRNIRRWVEVARERTKSENGYEWKVRGSPRSGLQLVKMKIWSEQSKKLQHVASKKQKYQGRENTSRIKERTKQKNNAI